MLTNSISKFNRIIRMFVSSFQFMLYIIVDILNAKSMFKLV